MISGKSLERRDPRLLLGGMERVADPRRRAVQSVFPELKRTRILDGAAAGTQAAASVHAHALPPEIPSLGHPAWEASAARPAPAGMLGLALGSSQGGTGPSISPSQGL